MKRQIIFYLKKSNLYQNHFCEIFAKIMMIRSIFGGFYTTLVIIIVFRIFSFFALQLTTVLYIKNRKKTIFFSIKGTAIIGINGLQYPVAHD